MASERPWLESLAGCVPHGLALVRPDGVILWANRAFSRLVGLEGAAKGTPAERWIGGWQYLSESAGSPDSASEMAITLLRADGTEREATARAVRCPAGIEAAWAIHLEDATEVQELRRRLQARERSYSFLRENTSDLIVRTNQQLTVLWTNQAGPVALREGASLPDLLAPGSVDLLRLAEAPETEVSLASAEGISPAFALRGIARRLADESGAPMGFTLLLRDDTEKQALARFVERHGLSPREQEIILYVIQGYSNLNIAAILGLSESGVKFHLRNVFSRARVASRTELMAELMTGG